MRFEAAGYQIYFNQSQRANVTVIKHISWTPHVFSTGLISLLRRYWLLSHGLIHANELCATDFCLISVKRGNWSHAWLWRLAIKRAQLWWKFPLDKLFKQKSYVLQVRESVRNMLACCNVDLSLNTLCLHKPNFHKKTKNIAKRFGLTAECNFPHKLSVWF